MFCVVNITEAAKEKALPKKRFFMRFKTHKKEAIAEEFQLSRIKEPSFPPFYIFTIPSSELTSENALKVFSAYKNRLIFPPDIQLPEEILGLSFNQKNYSLLRMKAFTEKTVAEIPKKPIIKTALIRDTDFITENAFLTAVPKIESVHIQTKNDDAFFYFSEKAMESFGAVILRANDNINLQRYSLIADIDNEAIYYKKCDNAAETLKLVPPPPVIPSELLKALPKNADCFSFAAAMYEIYGYMLDNE
ncbi:MAG TPA: hypothetical protein VFC76_00175 [Oscillospiraceae bacterium]|nr:hypothetical protein [Oscillospiraceae bacterium]